MSSKYVSLSKASTATGDTFQPISAVLRRATIAMLPAGQSPNDTEVITNISGRTLILHSLHKNLCVC